jgi:hypothetical protein
MSPSSFDSLANEKPELRSTLASIKPWAEAELNHTGLIDPRVLRRKLGDVDPVALALSLQLLVAKGIFDRVFMVVTPSGVLADGEYADPGDVPEWVADRFNNYFQVSEGDVVPVLKPAGR